MNHVGPEPQAIVITPDGKTAYVPSYKSGTVTPIPTATNTPDKPIKTGGGAPRSGRGERTVMPP